MVAIRVEGLGKRYRISDGSRPEYRTLRESLTAAASSPLRWLRRRPSAAPDTFWALDRVSFEVQPGEVLGIIGRNGSGKSTLLKILSRITTPTAGRAELHGRVGSLLEVGTGFHPELTGRENIYLNGAILGMYRREIARKFDEIVAFAGVEPFLDLPVKRYSSGMYVRLAFAVAAHLEPEILLVDEVLAVGDHAFQKKCVGKMSDIAAGGRTVLLVSHNLPMLSNLSSQAVWLDQGRLERWGEPNDVIRAYCERNTDGTGASVSLAEHSGRRAGFQKLLRSLTLSDSAGTPTNSIPIGEDLWLDVEVAGLAGHSDHYLILDVCDVFGTLLMHMQSNIQTGLDLSGLHQARVRCVLENVRLLPGDYIIHAGVGDSEDYVDKVEYATGFSVEPADLYGTGRMPRRRDGLFAPAATWHLLPAQPAPCDA